MFEKSRICSVRHLFSYTMLETKLTCWLQLPFSSFQVFLLLEDHNFSDPIFLDMVNGVLSSGEVPGLYSPEETEPLLAPLRERAKDEGFSGGDMMGYFARCVRRNMHVVLVSVPELVEL